VASQPRVVVTAPHKVLRFPTPIKHRFDKIPSSFDHVARGTVDAVLAPMCRGLQHSAPTNDRDLPSSRPARKRFGDYELIAPLATGGMGGVYLAKHATTGEHVALKVLDPLFANHTEVVTRLYSERTISIRATHPGLVQIREAARSSDGVPYLVMEYLDGRTLASIVDREPIDITTIIGLAAQIAAALAALHESGVIHCDVKPENLFVLAARAWGTLPQVKVIDFGVSRRVDEAPADDASIAGTPAYMAPEQWKGKPVTASDVYALGCVLYELVTGDTPFDGSLPQLMLAHLEQRPPRPTWLRAGLPLELERVIMRALSKDPLLRPTMRELADELGDLADAMMLTETMPMAIAV
jgi:serine/threonine protein kinase